MMILPLVLSAVFGIQLSRADSGDSVIAGLDRAKAVHADELKKAESTLLDALDAAIKKIASTGNLDATKAVADEKDAFQKDGKLPRSATMAGAVADYLRTRETEDKKLSAAYDEVIASYTKQLKLSEASAVKDEETRFQAAEERFAASLEINKPARPKADPHDEKTASVRDYLKEFISRVNAQIDKVAAEESSSKRDDAHNRMMKSFDEEIRGKTFTLRCPITDVKDGGRGKPTKEFWAAISPPVELAGLAGTSISAAFNGFNGYSPRLTADQAQNFKPGDVLVFEGKGRFGLANGRSASRSERQNARLILTFTSEVSKQSYGVFMQNPTYKIEHGHRVEERVGNAGRQVEEKSKVAGHRIEEIAKDTRPAPIDDKDLRSQWINSTYSGVVLRRIADKKWAEFNSDTGKLRLKYEETDRTKDYIELFCSDLQQKKRVFSDKMEIYKDGKWGWVSKGRWDESPAK